MRFGGPVFGTTTPEGWVAAHRAAGYRAAAYWPGPPEEMVDDYLRAAREADLLIAEVGAWSNTLLADAEKRKEAIAYCQRQLALADRVGARCCVNIPGSRGTPFHGPCAEDLTEETFQMVVDTVREIIDAVNPTRTCYALETMPWMFPDSAESYLRLLQAIDRPGFGVHVDPVNMINSPTRYFQADRFIRETFALLGPYVRGCHLKDVIIRDHMPLQLDEVRPGAGSLNYAVLLRELAKLDPDTPVILEHLPEHEYPLAAQYIQETAARIGVEL